MAIVILRRLLLPVAVVYVFLLLVLKSPPGTTVKQPNAFSPVDQELFHVQIKRPFTNGSKDHATETERTATETILEDNGPETTLSEWSPASRVTALSALVELTECPVAPNQYTNHIRLPDVLHNITMKPKSGLIHEDYQFWNPTIVALPSWAKNQYIIVSMALQMESSTGEILSAKQISAYLDLTRLS